MLRPRRPRRRPGADDALAGLAGLVAGGLALGLAQVVVALLHAGSPLLALGSATVDLTPGWLKDAVVAGVGTHDKVVLLSVLGLVVAALAAATGVLERARRDAGTRAVAVLGALTAVAAMSRHGAGAVAGLPTLVGFVAGGFALRALVDRLRPEWTPRSQRSARSQRSQRSGMSQRSGPSQRSERPQRTGLPERPERAGAPGSPADPGRRAFLAGTAAAALVALAGVGAGHLLSAAARTATAARARIRLPRPATPAPAVPAGVQPRLRGLTPYLQPTADFYRIDTALTVPRIDPATWSLRVHGLVDHELHLDYADLLAEDLDEARVTLSCVSNEVGGDLVGNATWLGVPIARLMARAAPRAGADMVLSASADGFTAATPLDALTDPARGALLAVGMDGAPLPFEHGFPVRMVVPGLYGYVSATKWLTDLRVTRYADATSYWTQRGWAAKAPVKTESRIDVPSDGAHLRAGRTTLGGVAWAPSRGVSGVQVRVDEGPWREAVMAADGGIDTWRLWTLAWEADAGTHTLTVRATDGTGAVQTAAQAPPEPDGASGWHQVRVHVS